MSHIISLFEPALLADLVNFDGFIITIIKPDTVHNVQFVKYDVTVSFMAQVLDTVAYLVSQVLDTASSSNCLVRFYRLAI